MLCIDLNLYYKKYRSDWGDAVPIVELHLLEGYDDTAKTRLGQALTDAIRFVVPAAPEAITVMIHERQSSQYMRGREHKSGAPSLPDPEKIVLAYLAAMEARDLGLAQGFLADSFEMVFPGTAPMHSLAELIAWARPRYQFVTKTYEQTESFQSPGPATVVYTRGTLQGAWPDGTAFADIRFIDRFELQGGKITRQDVWNDIAEVRP